MKQAYSPGCALLLYKPQLAEKILLELNKKQSEIKTHTICCHYEPGLDSGTEIISTCSGCNKRFNGLYEGISSISLWEVLEKSESFDFPDYNGMEMTIHDACPSRNLPAVHNAVRNLLNKMNIKVIEPKDTRGKSICCGDSFYKKIPYGEVKLLMKKSADSMPKDEVVVYCVSCIKSMHIGGKRPRHIIDLLFGEDTVPGVYETDKWHDELDAFMEATKNKIV